MKTDKFNNMISAFQCDLSLELEGGGGKLRVLEDLIKNKNQRLLEDIKLLEELEFLLRYGKAEIHLIEDDNEGSSTEDCVGVKRNIRDMFTDIVSRIRLGDINNVTIDGKAIENIDYRVVNDTLDITTL